MLPIQPIYIAAVALAFALTTHAQVCNQCPVADNIDRPLTGNTPLVPGAGMCCIYGGQTCCYDSVATITFDGSGFCPQNFVPIHRSCFVNGQ
ncbi:hypothetical protein DFH08DRAFT_905936 [Mycena albidolilacea]|uniref:Uncharacterized protein n=1 Tax=Mycena albidolilacea TaxID=1033008 RepID=A0AAD7E8R6_9AGAR|nr:hypothetical protein DFH08DRAFT_905936 [Mycena albidolilacea]